MVKLTETANLQIVDDNLLPTLRLKESQRPLHHVQQVTHSRQPDLALYFNQSSAHNNNLKKSISLHSPSLQRHLQKRMVRWMSVKGDRI